MKNFSWDRPAKNAWRQDFWREVDQTLPCELRKYAHVMILAGKDGLEIPLIVDGCGIPEENIHAVDYNAAMLATAKWRKRWPGVKCYGVALSAATRRISASLTGDHRVRVINLDFCSNLTAALLDEISLTRRGLDLSAGAVIQINLLKGRENPLVPVLLGQLGYDNRASWALDWFLNEPVRGLYHERSGQYQDGSSPMQWARGVLQGDSKVTYYRGNVSNFGYAFDWHLLGASPDGSGSFNKLQRAQFRVLSDWFRTRKVVLSEQGEGDQKRAFDVLWAADCEAAA